MVSGAKNGCQTVRKQGSGKKRQAAEQTVVQHKRVAVEKIKKIPGWRKNKMIAAERIEMT